MKTILLSALLLFPAALIAQCDGIRFREFVFTDFEKTANLTYGNNITHEGNALDLLLDVYEPAGDSETARPLVIFAHGGFFISGSKDGEDVVPLCEDLARMGYVSASINYRLGFPFTNLEARATEAALRGVHDMKAAIRWFRKSVAESGNPYGIDPDQIYVGGVSAGGFIALHLAYLDDDAEVPDYIDFDNPGLAGGLEGESGNDEYPSNINAIINIAGAIGEKSWITAGDEPALLLHGDVDTTVPYATDMQYVLGILPITEVDGSFSIAQQMEEVGVTHCFETHEGFNHVPHVSNAAVYDTTLSIISNFLSHFICDVELDCEYRELSVDVNESILAESFEVFPNPAVDRFRVRYNAPGMALLSLYDLTGRRVMQSNVRSGEEVQTDALPDGAYLVECTIGDRRATQRVIVTR
ncbi:MAG: carboxylesterase family protein [Flavobacteriales bacterium]|jgi:poly(3-hydroxybutyrate) depolymerase